jgi:hypothetical protein
MRTIFKRRHFLALFLGLGICLPASAQAPEGEMPKVGFIRLVNAVGPGTGNINLKIDGKDKYPTGYKLGQRTGGIGLPVGAKKITVTKEGVEEGSTNLMVKQGETVTLVAFAEKVPAKDEKPEHWAMRILLLKQRDAEDGFRLTVLSMCDEQETLFAYQKEADKEPTMTSVKRLMTTTIELGKRGGDVVLYQRDKKTLLSMFRPDNKGNYVVMLYNDGTGALKALYFYDPKFVIAGG